MINVDSIVDGSNVVVLRAGTRTQSKKLASSIIAQDTTNPSAKLLIRAIGAGALNQAYKGVVAASAHFATQGKTLYVRPSYDTITVDGHERSVAVLEVVKS